MGQPAPSTPPGQLVLGRYRPVRPLGSGGSGTVWLATEEETGRPVALKMVPREGTAGSRAEREAAAAAKLRHERCLRALALGRDSGHVYIAYEYVAGRTLRELMRGGELNDAAAIDAAAQVLDGLAHAHENGIVHRDVKPANILVRDGREMSVKLMDFGLALMREEQTLTAQGDIPGTLAYISPERLRGHQAEPAADVWAVGVMLWESLAGTHPFWGGTLLETAKLIEDGAPPLKRERPDLPRELIGIVERALAVDPGRRPEAADLAKALRRVRLSRRPAQRRRRALSLPGVPSLPSLPALPSFATHLELPRFGSAARTGLPAASCPTARIVEVAAPAIASGVGAALAASALPFFPSGWAAALGLLTAAIAAWRPAAGLALALAAPVLPLGNASLGLATAYAVAATAWFLAMRRSAREGAFVTLGLLLAPIGGLGLLPLAVQKVRSEHRRALLAATAVLAGVAASRADRVDSLGLDGTNSSITAAIATGRALAHDRGTLGLVLVCAAVSVAVPRLRALGSWVVAGAAAAMIAVPLLLDPSLPALPTILSAWAVFGLLAVEPEVRARLRETDRPGAPSLRTVTPVLLPVLGAVRAAGPRLVAVAAGAQTPARQRPRTRPAAPAHAPDEETRALEDAPTLTLHVSASSLRIADPS